MGIPLAPVIMTTGTASEVFARELVRLLIYEVPLVPAIVVATIVALILWVAVGVGRGKPQETRWILTLALFWLFLSAFLCLSSLLADDMSLSGRLIGGTFGVVVFVFTLWFWVYTALPGGTKPNERASDHEL